MTAATQFLTVMALVLAVRQAVRIRGARRDIRLAYAAGLREGRVART